MQQQYECPRCKRECLVSQFGFGWVAICPVHGVVYNKEKEPERKTVKCACGCEQHFEVYE